MIAKCDETYTKVFSGLQLAGFEYMGTDLLDVFRCGVDITALAAGTVLDKDEVTVDNQSFMNETIKVDYIFLPLSTGRCESYTGWCIEEGGGTGVALASKSMWSSMTQIQDGG
jgi:hypothetical protein